MNQPLLEMGRIVASRMREVYIPPLPGHPQEEGPPVVSPWIWYSGHDLALCLPHSPPDPLLV